MGGALTGASLPLAFQAAAANRVVGICRKVNETQVFQAYLCLWRVPGAEVIFFFWFVAIVAIPNFVADVQCLCSFLQAYFKLVAGDATPALVFANGFVRILAAFGKKMQIAIWARINVGVSLAVHSAVAIKVNIVVIDVS
jgi:hypothetical protein